MENFKPSCKKVKLSLFAIIWIIFFISLLSTNSYAADCPKTIDCTDWERRGGYCTNYVWSKVPGIPKTDAIKIDKRGETIDVKEGDAAIFKITKYGHVAYVEKVHRDQNGKAVSIDVSEMNNARSPTFEEFMETNYPSPPLNKTVEEWERAKCCAVTINFSIITQRKTIPIGIIHHIWSPNPKTSSTTSTPQQDATRLNGIKQAFLDILGRNADTGGLNAYYNSNLSIDSIRQSLLNSNECKQGKGGECARRYSQASQQSSSQTQQQGTATQSPGSKPSSAPTLAPQQPALGDKLNQLVPTLKRFPIPMVTRIEPTTGGSGIIMGIYGTDLNPTGSFVGTIITFESSLRPKIIVKAIPPLNDNVLKVMVPEGSGNVQVHVETAGGQSGKFTFTYKTPLIKSISPEFGERGQVVTFVGENFGVKQALELNRVKFGDSLANIIQWDDQRIVVKSPMDFGTGTNKNILLSLGGCIADLPEVVRVLIDLPGCGDLFKDLVKLYQLSTNPGFIERQVPVSVQTTAGKSNERNYTYKVHTEIRGTDTSSTVPSKPSPTPTSASQPPGVSPSLPQTSTQQSVPSPAPKQPILPIASFVDGTIVRLKGQNQVYVIQGGRKCYIPDSNTFNAKGYSWDQIRDIDQTSFNSIPTGIALTPIKATIAPPTVSSKPSLAPMPPTQPPKAISSLPQTSPQQSVPTPAPKQPGLPIASFVDGTLIQLRGQYNVYVIQGGKKCYIPDTETFTARGCRWDQVRIIDQTEFNSYSTGTPLASVKTTIASPPVTTKLTPAPTPAPQPKPALPTPSPAPPVVSKPSQTRTPAPQPKPVNPQIRISTSSSSSGGASISGLQGVTFYIQGNGFSTNSPVQYHVKKPDGKEFPPSDFRTDGTGNFSYTSASQCDSPVGTYSLWVIDKTTGKGSNTIAETITKNAKCK